MIGGALEGIQDDASPDCDCNCEVDLDADHEHGLLCGCVRGCGDGRAHVAQDCGCGCGCDCGCAVGGCAEGFGACRDGHCGAGDHRRHHCSYCGRMHRGGRSRGVPCVCLVDHASDCASRDLDAAAYRGCDYDDEGSESESETISCGLASLAVLGRTFVRRLLLWERVRSERKAVRPMRKATPTSVASCTPAICNTFPSTFHPCLSCAEEEVVVVVVVVVVV